MIEFNPNIFYSLKKLGPQEGNSFQIFQKVYYVPMIVLNVRNIRAKQTSQVSALKKILFQEGDIRNVNIYKQGHYRL